MGTCRRYRWLALAGLAALAWGCASTAPFERDAPERAEVTPRQAAAEEQWQGEAVLWGGRILRVDHLEEKTQVEIVAYPLDRGQRPRTQATPEGRFLVDYPGFLESADYRPGRLVTVDGTIAELRSGRVGEQRIDYPVIATESIHLWPQATAQQSRQPQVRFGVGVQLSR